MEIGAAPAFCGDRGFRGTPHPLMNLTAGRPSLSPLRRVPPATPPTACPSSQEKSDNSRQVLRRMFTRQGLSSPFLLCRAGARKGVLSDEFFSFFRDFRVASLTLFEQRPQFLAVSATRGQRCTVLERDYVFAVKVGLELSQPVDVDDRRAMNSHEFRRIEPGLQGLDGVAHQVPASGRVKCHVVAFGVDPIDILNANEIDLAIRSNRKS